MNTRCYRLIAMCFVEFLSDEFPEGKEWMLCLPKFQRLIRAFSSQTLLDYLSALDKNTIRWLDFSLKGKPWQKSSLSVMKIYVVRELHERLAR